MSGRPEFFLINKKIILDFVRLKKIKTIKISLPVLLFCKTFYLRNCAASNASWRSLSCSAYSEFYFALAGFVILVSFVKKIYSSFSFTFYFAPLFFL
jgi:hypothetical protein